MTDFTPWTLFCDIGIVSILLLVGKILRVKIKFIQRFFIPPSLIAGFIGLALGPGGFNYLPFSNHIGTYVSILIAMIFSCLSFCSQGRIVNGNKIAKMWVYSQTGMLWQWAFGGFLGLLVLTRIWPVEEFFGIVMPAGYIGGHGTAAAIGDAFSKFGYDEMLTLSMTAATAGIIGSVFIGLGLIKWGTNKGYATFLTDFSSLPDELRSGLLPEEKRESMGTATCSSISIDPLTLNFIVIMIVAFGGYCMSKIVTWFVPGLSVPVFSCAFVFGIFVRLLFVKLRAINYVCPKTMGHLSGFFTDLLIAFGISAIKLDIVMQYLVPLLLLLGIGLIITLVYVLVVGKVLMKNDYWFEKALFTWGWFTGTMAMGIALLRVVDPKMKSHCLEDYALAYLFIAPVEISLITFAPIAFIKGYGIVFLLTAFILGSAIMIYAHAKGWLKK